MTIEFGFWECTSSQRREDIPRIQRQPLSFGTKGGQVMGKYNFTHPEARRPVIPVQTEPCPLPHVADIELELNDAGISATPVTRVDSASNGCN
jgi:hypothetical protein